MILPTILALLFVGCVFLLAFKNKRTYILFLLLIPLLSIIDNVYFHFLPASVVSFCFFASAFSIALFPLIFLSDYFKKNLGLLILVSLLMEWDWLVTWSYVAQNSAAELNTFLNVSSFWVFSMQKLSPLLLIGLLYFIAKDEVKLMRILDISMVVIAVCYYVLFVWHLYVVSVVSTSIYYLLLIALFTGAFSATGMIKMFFANNRNLVSKGC